MATVSSLVVSACLQVWGGGGGREGPGPQIHVLEGDLPLGGEHTA